MSVPVYAVVETQPGTKRMRVLEVARGTIQDFTAAVKMHESTGQDVRIVQLAGGEYYAVGEEIWPSDIVGGEKP